MPHVFVLSCISRCHQIQSWDPFPGLPHTSCNSIHESLISEMEKILCSVIASQLKKPLLVFVCRYDPQKKQWSHVSSMSSPRSTAGVAVLEDKLYVVGGRDSNSCLNSMECYDPHTDTWTRLPPMRARRGGVGVVVVAEKLYAIGGHEVLAPLNSVEVYDPKTKEWSWGVPMLCARDAVAAVAFGGKIYVVGGFNGDMYLDSVECYDPESCQWNMVSSLSWGRAGAGVVVMDFPMEKLLQQRQSTNTS